MESVANLSSVNQAYINNAASKPDIRSIEPIQDTKNDDSKKLLGTLAGLTILAIGTIAVVNKIKKGKNIPILPKNEPPVKISKFDKNWKIEKVGNGKIKVVPKVSEINGKPVQAYEVPEYLYHFTSKKAFEKIEESGVLKCSKNEQLPGIFLLDENAYFNHYANFVKKDSGQKKDLAAAILKQANRKNAKENSGELVLIKIPTEELIKSGKLRIRTQEDFFFYQDEVRKLQNGLAKKSSLRELCDDAKREEFKDHVIRNNLMSKSELDRFMQDMEQKIHRGQKINKFSNLENDNAIEFIYNKDINLADFKGIKYTPFSINDFKTSKNGNVDYTNLRTIFQ